MSDSGRTLIHNLVGLKTLDAVSEYVLVREDGEIMLHNHNAPGPFAELILVFGRNCDSLDLPAGFPRFRHFILTRETGENLLVLPLGNYYLGYIQSSHLSSRQAASQVLDFIRDIL